MVDHEDNFNDFLKKKIEETEFEYNDAYWQKAQSLINAQNVKKKRGGFILWPFIAIVSIALLSGSYYLGTTQANGNSAALPINNNATADKMIAINSVNLNSNNDVAKPTVAPSKMPITANLLTNNALNSNTRTTTFESPNPVATVALDATNITASTNKFKPSKNKNNTKNNLLYNSPKNAVSSDIVSHLNIAARNLNLPLHPEPELITTNDEQEETTASILPLSISVDSAPANEEMNADRNKPDLFCDNKKPLKWRYTAFIGLADSRGFENNKSASIFSGFGFFVGGSASYIINQNWMVGMQPLLYLRGAVNTKEISQKSDYDFGISESQFIVHNKQILFLEVPLVVNYNIKRHTIGVGVGAEYLINVKSDVKDFGESVYKTNQWGYTEGYNRVGMMALVTYQYRLYNQLSLVLHVQKGFTDFTKNSYFTLDGKDLNFNMRIGVLYSFTQKNKYQK